MENKTTEKTMFGTHSGEAISFYPVVAFARGPLVIGTLNRFAGDAREALRFDRVTNVAVNALAPRERARKYPVTTPLILLAKNPQVAAFDYPVKDRKPLQLMTFDKLRKRALTAFVVAAQDVDTCRKRKRQRFLRAVRQRRAHRTCVL